MGTAPTRRFADWAPGFLSFRQRLQVTPFQFPTIADRTVGLLWRKDSDSYAFALDCLSLFGMEIESILNRFAECLQHLFQCPLLIHAVNISPHRLYE